MEGILKVTPERLLQTSEEFAAAGNQMKGLTGEMMTLVQNLRSIWQGEASESYGNKFHTLQGDMDRLYRMVEEHVADLKEMAEQYQNAETGNTQQSGGLQGSLVV